MHFNHLLVQYNQQFVSWVTSVPEIYIETIIPGWLGATHMVYPGAMHSRFEHSLGVYWLAGEAVHKLKAQQVCSLESVWCLITLFWTSAIFY